MTINDLITELEGYGYYYVIALGCLPLIALVYSFFHKSEEGNNSPHGFVYSGLVHAASFPGVCGIVLTFYTLFILQGNLLDVSFIVYFFPILILILTVYLVSRVSRISDLPGIDRLNGLLIIVGVTFVLALIVLKTRIFMFFGGSIQSFGIFVLLLFALIRFGSYKLLKKKPKL